MLSLTANIYLWSPLSIIWDLICLSIYKFYDLQHLSFVILLRYNLFLNEYLFLRILGRRFCHINLIIIIILKLSTLTRTFSMYIIRKTCVSVIQDEQIYFSLHYFFFCSVLILKLLIIACSLLRKTTIPT